MIATGRSLNATLPIIEHIGIENGYAVCSNGGVTLRLDAGLADGYEVLAQGHLRPRPRPCGHCASGCPPPSTRSRTRTATSSSTERFQDASFGVEAIGVDFQTMLEATAVRVVVFSSENTPEEFNAAIRHIGLAGVTYSVGWTAWLDIAAAGVTKASALETAARHGSASRRTARWPSATAGTTSRCSTWARRGVAMGQAPAEVIAAADEVTHSVYDDGAAHVLRSLLGVGRAGSAGSRAASGRRGSGPAAGPRPAGQRAPRSTAPGPRPC